MTSHAPRADWRVHLALLVVQLSFGGFSVVGKVALQHLHPLALASLRLLLAAPLLLALSLLRDRAVPPLRELPRLALLGLLGVCINQVLFIVGLSYTTAVNSAILMPSIPVFTLIVAALLGIERLTGRTVAGVLLAVAGALVMLDPTRLGTAGGQVFGNVLVLLNCLSYSFFLVLARPALRRIPPMMLTAWSSAIGAVVVAAIGAPALAATDLGALPSSAWLALGYIVLLATFMNYLLNTWAIGRSSSALVAGYTTLQPVVAGVLAVLFLGEQVGWREAAGFVLIVTGLLRITPARTADGPGVPRTEPDTPRTTPGVPRTEPPAPRQASAADR